MTNPTQRGILSRNYLDGYPSSSSRLLDSLTDSTILSILTRNLQRTAIQPTEFVRVDSVLQSSADNYFNIYGECINLWLSKLQHYKLQHCKKLSSSLDFRPGWDGEDGRAPTKQDVDNAINFLNYIPPRGIMSARVGIAGDGEVGFDWRESGICLEVGFNDGEISFFAERNGTESGAEMDFKNGIPEELRLLMSTCFSG